MKELMGGGKVKILFSLLKKYSSLRNKILLFMVIFTSLPFAFLAGYIYINARKDIEAEYSSGIRRELDRCTENINNELMLYFKKSNFIINSFINSNMFRGQEHLEGWSVEKLYDFNKNMDIFISNFEYDAANSNKGIFTFYLENYMGIKGKYIEDMKVLNEGGLTEKILESPISEILWSQRMSEDNTGNKYITFFRNITPVINMNGILEVNVPFRNISRYMESIGIPDNGYFSYQDDSGKVEYENRESVVNGPISGIEETSDLLIVKNEMKLIDGRQIMVVVPEKNIYRVSGYTIFLTSMGFLFLLVLIVFISNITSKKITKRLNDFIEFLKDNDEKLLNERLVKIYGEDEISVISQKFVNLIKDLITAKNQNNVLEMELLQACINPHLLYNSLSVIKWNALHQNDQKTAEIVDAMTSYYRHALSRGNNIIELANELNMIREFVNIVSYTHACHYNLYINVQENMMNNLILKHLLQPVVENAIMHGLRGKGRDAGIWIDGYIENNNLIFVIRDNGYGMDELRIKEVLGLNYKSGKGGYGLKNSINRIKLFYGDNYGIDIRSGPGAGTSVTIRVNKIFNETSDIGYFRFSQ